MILVRFVRGLVSIMRASKDAIVIVFFLFVCFFFQTSSWQGFLKAQFFPAGNEMLMLACLIFGDAKSFFSLYS